MEALIFILLFFTWISIRKVRLRQDELELRLKALERFGTARITPEAAPVAAASTYEDESAYVVAPTYDPRPTAAAATAYTAPTVRESGTVSYNDFTEPAKPVVTTPAPEPVAKAAPEPVIAEQAPEQVVAVPEPEPVQPQAVYYVQEEVPAAYYNNSAAEQTAPEPEQAEEVVVASRADTTSLEQRIGSRWLVWLGGLSLILGGAYFVAYSVEQGWLSLGLRLTLSSIFGLVLMGVGEKLRRNPRFTDVEGKIVSLPQSVSAGGAGILFASIYALYKMADIISQPVAFAALAAVSLLTLFTSLRQGVIMAVIGLIGAYSVPAILGVHGNITLLITYLLALSVLAEVLEHRRGWKALHPIALWANLLWCFVPLIYATGPVQYWAMSYLLVLGALYSTKLRGREISIGLLLTLVVQKLSLMVPFGGTAQLITLAGFALPLVAAYKRKDNIGPMLSGLFALAVTAVCFGPGVLDMSLNTLMPLAFAAVLLVSTTRRCENTDNEIQFVALLPLAIMVAFWGKMSGFARSDEWGMLFIGFATLNGLLHAYSVRRVSAELPVPSIFIANVTAALLVAVMTHFEGTQLATVLALYVPVAAWLCRRTTMLVNLLALVAGYAILRTLMLEDIFTHPLNQPGALSWIILSFGVPMLAYLAGSWLLRGRAAFANTRSVVELGGLLHAVLLPYALVRWSQGSANLIEWPLSFSEASMLGTLWLLLAVGGMRIETVRQSLIGKAGCYTLAIGATLSLVFGPLLAFNPLFSEQPARFMTLLLAYGVPAALYIGAIRPLMRLGRVEIAQLAGAIGFVFAMMLSLLEVFYFSRGETLIGNITLTESTSLALLWGVVGCALALYPAVGDHVIGRWMARLTALAGFVMLGFFSLLLLNPLLTGEAVGTLAVLNLLLPAYGLPAALLMLLARELYRRELADAASTAATGALVFGMTYSVLEVLHSMGGTEFIGALGFKQSAVLGLLWVVAGCAALSRPQVRAVAMAQQAFAVLVGAGFTVLFMLSLIVFNPWLNQDYVGSLPVFNWLLPAFGVPALILVAITQQLQREGKNDMATNTAVAGLLFGMSYIGLEVLHLMRGDGFIGTFNFREATLIGLIWALIGGIAGTRDRVVNNPIARQAYDVLTTAGLLVLTVLPLLVLNPLWSGTPVGELPVLNWLLLAYGLPTLLLAYVVRDQAKRGRAKHIIATGSAVLALVYLFTWLSLEVRHAYHGSVLTGPMTQAEWYTYSAVWLLSGFAILAAGVWRRAKMLRQAALAVILLTVAKVFFSDMGALTGLLRAASFLGLGVALMGVGYLYQRFVLGEVEEAKKAS